MAISLVSLTSGLSWAAGPAAAQTDVSERTVRVEAEEPQCLSNAPAYIGIYMENLTDTIKDECRYPHENGVYVAGVAVASPAEKAGLKEHDIVYRFGKDEVEDSIHLCSLVQARKPGDKVSIVYYRDGERKSAFVTIGTRELPSAMALQNEKLAQEYMKRANKAAGMRFRMMGEPSLLRGRLGMVLEDLNKDLAPYFNVKEDEGVLVVQVEEDSPAEKAGVKAGDVITAVGGEPVHSVEALASEVSKAGEGDTLTVALIRKGVKKSLPVEVEAGGAEVYFYGAPFEWNANRLGRIGRSGRQTELGPGERERIKKDIDSLKEELKDLEERLDEMQKRK